MIATRKAIGTTLVVLAVAIVVILGTIGFVMLSSPSAPTVTTSFTSSTSSSSKTSSTSTLSQSTSYSNCTSAAPTLTLCHTTSTTTASPIPIATVEVANFSGPGGYYLFDQSNDRFYVLGVSTLSVIDISSQSLIATVQLPANNTGGLINAGLAVDYSTGMIYAAVEGEVVELNGSSNTLAGELPLNVGTLAFDPTTNTLWGTQPNHWRLVGFDILTDSVVANVSVGFSPYDVAVDPSAGLVYSVGCNQEGLVCDSQAAIVNATSGTLFANLTLGSDDYPTMALDTATRVLYVTGGEQLAAINGTTGKVIFNENPQTCGPFTNIVVDPSTNLVYTSPNSNYLLAYDGLTGNLTNMYSFGNTVGPIGFNSNNGELYVGTAGNLIAMRPVSTPGNVDIALLGSTNQCPLP